MFISPNTSENYMLYFWPFNYLGIIISDHLDWNPQTSDISSRAMFLCRRETKEATYKMLSCPSYSPGVGGGGVGGGG